MAQDDDGRKLFIGGISFNTDERSLREAFEKYGPVKEARVMTDRETNKPRGFAFVTFENTKDADDAVSGLNNVELDGRTIRVDHAKSRSGGAPSGGGFDSRRGGSSSYGGGSSSGGRSNVCFDFQRGSCSRSNCRFEHTEGGSGSGSGSGGDRRGGSSRGGDYERGGDRYSQHDNRGGYDDRRGGEERSYGGSSRY